MRAIAHVCGLILLAGAVAAAARTTVIDDSATLPNNAPLALHWQQLSPRRPVNNLLTGTLSVRVKLNVAPWLHRNGRIYLRLPAQPPGRMTASWTTQGRLLPGSLESGTRTLVYSGPVSAPFIEDVLQLTLNVDASQIQQLYRVNFTFEMDED
jgi:hypothetical protein